jgi:hypothetical protein
MSAAVNGAVDFYDPTPQPPPTGEPGSSVPLPVC